MPNLIPAIPYLIPGAFVLGILLFVAGYHVYALVRLVAKGE
jgi:hypothetical protein